MASFLSKLSDEFPSDFVSQEEGDLEAYGRDWTRVHTPDPLAVVFPRTTDEVARFLGLCHREGVAVVPSGGRTGLAGGAVACRGEVVLSLERMRAMEEVEMISRSVRVQAGAVNQAVQEHCAPVGLMWPVDLASKGSCQVGGNISTNAGGVRAVRYGVTRPWVMGLQVVTMEGKVLSLDGRLEKNNTGLDLRQLFIGSEGVLGVIVEATLRLTALPAHPLVLFLALPGLGAALPLYQRALDNPALVISAFELISGNCLELVLERKGRPSPLAGRHPSYLLMEVEGGVGVDSWVEGLMGSPEVLDGTLAQSLRQARDLWALREDISESLQHKGLVHKNDISIPVAAFGHFVEKLQKEISQVHLDFELFLFGHVGDGNIHINVLKPESMNKEAFLEHCERADQALYGLVSIHGGSISGEHGIGLLKKQALPFSRSPEEIKIFRSIKGVLDPQGLLNPGKIFD